jgi:hypothetical protein
LNLDQYRQAELDRAWNKQNEQRLKEEEARNKLEQEVLNVRSTQVQTKGMKCCHGTDRDCIGDSIAKR